MTQKYFWDGKVRKSTVLPQGYYVHDRELNMPRMIDPDFEGFRISYGQLGTAEKSRLQIITDGIEVKSLADGKVYTSKKKYYDSLKSSGSHVTEAGEFGRKREIQGDFNARRELKQALTQHLGRR